MGARSSQCCSVISDQCWPIWNYQLYGESAIELHSEGPRTRIQLRVAHEVKPPTKFISQDGRRTTQAHGKLFQHCSFSQRKVYYVV